MLIFFPSWSFIDILTYSDLEYGCIRGDKLTVDEHNEISLRVNAEFIEEDAKMIPLCER